MKEIMVTVREIFLDDEVSDFEVVGQSSWGPHRFIYGYGSTMDEAIEDFRAIYNDHVVQARKEGLHVRFIEVEDV